jgi:hypothetical protein
MQVYNEKQYRSDEKWNAEKTRNPIQFSMTSKSYYSTRRYKKLGRDMVFFLSYMQVFLNPSLLNKEDVWPGTKTLFTINKKFFPNFLII